MRSRWNVAQFARALLTKAVLIAFVVVDAISYVLLGGQIPAYIYPVVLALGLAVAAYQVYADLNMQIALLKGRLESLEGTPPRVLLRLVSVMFGGHGWQNRMPSLPLRFLATMDLRNLSDQRATLTEIRVNSMSISSNLIGHTATRVNCFPTGSPRRGASEPLPLVLDPHHWNPRAICEIEVDLLEKDPHKFAARLRELEDFEIHLQYSYELLSRPPATEQLLIPGDFTAFREAVLDHWRQSKDEHLLSAALPLNPQDPQ